MISPTSHAMTTATITSGDGRDDPPDDRPRDVARQGQLGVRRGDESGRSPRRRPAAAGTTSIIRAATTRSAWRVGSKAWAGAAGDRVAPLGRGGSSVAGAAAATSSSVATIRMTSTSRAAASEPADHDPGEQGAHADREAARRRPDRQAAQHDVDDASGRAGSPGRPGSAGRRSAAGTATIPPRTRKRGQGEQPGRPDARASRAATLTSVAPRVTARGWPRLPGCEARARARGHRAARGPPRPARSPSP